MRNVGVMSVWGEKIGLLLGNVREFNGGLGGRGDG